MAKREPAKKAPKRTPKKKKGKAKKRERKPTLQQHLAKFRGDVSADVATVNTLADLDCVAHVRRWVSTGCLELDRVLTPPALHESGEIGGIPCGRVIEIFGPAHIGKSTLLDHIFSSVQKTGGAAILLETDAGRDEHYSGRIGVDTKSLQYFQFAQDQASIEAVTDEAITAIRWWKTHAPDVPVVVGFDALGVTPTKEEIKKSVMENTTASAAKIMRKACRKLAANIAGSNVAFIVLNHEYQVISFGGGPQARKTYGGDALPLLSAVRIKLHPVKDGWLKEADGTKLGRRVGYSVEKFKLGSAFRDGSFALLSGLGIDNTWTLWETLCKAEIITVGGSWGAVNINGEVTKFQGWNALRRICQERPEFFAQLVDVYRQHVRSQDGSHV